MKNILVIICFFCEAAFAQVSKTVVNAFIEKPNVQWAIYFDETTFKNETLSTQLIKDFNAKKLRLFEPLTNGNKIENSIAFYNNKNIDSINNQLGEVLTVIDENGSVIKTVKAAESIETYITNNPIIVQQIFYVDNGILKSTVTRASISKELITPSGNNLGFAAIISFAHNVKNNIQNKPTDRIVYLGTTNTIILNESLANNYIKKMYNLNLVATLWPYITSNKIKSYSNATKQLISFPINVAENILNLPIVFVPMYDTVGNPISKKVIEEINDESFNKIGIEQQWFYNATQQIFYNKVIATYLYYTDFNKAPIYEKPLLKLVF